MRKTVELSLERNWRSWIFSVSKLGVTKFFQHRNLGVTKILKADFPVGGYENFPSMPLGGHENFQLDAGGYHIFWGYWGGYEIFWLIWKSPPAPRIPVFVSAPLLDLSLMSFYRVFHWLWYKKKTNFLGVWTPAMDHSWFQMEVMLGDFHHSNGLIFWWVYRE